MAGKIGSLIVVALIAVAGYQLYFLILQWSGLTAELASVVGRTEKINVENRQLESDIVYFSHQENLLKEARARFNYKAPGEKMLIIVPKKQEMETGN